MTFNTAPSWRDWNFLDLKHLLHRLLTVSPCGSGHACPEVSGLWDGSRLHHPCVPRGRGQNASAAAYIWKRAEALQSSVMTASANVIPARPTAGSRASEWISAPFRKTLDFPGLGVHAVIVARTGRQLRSCFSELQLALQTGAVHQTHARSRTCTQDRNSHATRAAKAEPWELVPLKLQPCVLHPLLS